MKDIIIILLAVILITSGKPESKRCFMIGYGGTTSTGLPWTGGHDTVLNKYPNLYEFNKFFSKKYTLTSVRIFAITEYSAADRLQFWKDSNIIQ